MLESEGHVAFRTMTTSAACTAASDHGAIQAKLLQRAMSRPVAPLQLLSVLLSEPLATTKGTADARVWTLAQGKTPPNRNRTAGPTHLGKLAPPLTTGLGERWFLPPLA